MLGLPEVFLSDGSTGGGGVIQGSASEAILTCIIAARERYIRKVLSSEGLEETPDETESQRIHREDRSAALTSRMVILASEQSHSSGQKAANILGLRFRSVKAGRDTMYKVTGANLRAKIEECKKNGLEPFFMHATIGTTSLCAVDELGEIAEVKKDYPDLWLHIDAAYAGAALICEEYRALAKHEFIGEYDSFNFNMHKWLLVNFDARCVQNNSTSHSLPFSVPHLWIMTNNQQHSPHTRPHLPDRRPLHHPLLSHQPLSNLRSRNRLPRLANPARPPLQGPQNLVCDPQLRCQWYAEIYPAYREIGRVDGGTCERER